MNSSAPALSVSPRRAAGPARPASMIRLVRIVVGWSLLVGSVTGRAAAPPLIESPLAPRSGPRGATMFHRLPASATGITVQNNYDDPRMWGDRSRRFLYGSLGSGVAIGDYDGDGRPDILVVSKVEGHRLFRNLGHWRFEDATRRAGVESPPGGEWEQGASWADVNNDGRLDLYVCRGGAPNLLYVNRGDGTFAEEAAARGLAADDDSVMAAFCDYDRDGWLDVYVVTNALYEDGDAGRPDLLFHNNGDGTFTDVTAKAGIGRYPFQGHAAIWWDYDDDGWPDLYVANDYSAPDVIYHNDGDGTFSLHGNNAVPHTPSTSMGADLGDLNDDGRIDLIATDMAPTTHEKDQRTMAEARAKLNDPFLDPLTVVQLARNALFLNTGTGTSREAAELAGIAATGWTWSVRCEDLDCDGRLDLQFTTGMNREQNNVDLNRRMSAAGTLRQQLVLMKSSPVLRETNLAFRNLGDLRFENVSAAWGLDELGVSFGAAFGDLDGDGDLDLVYTNYQAGVTVLRNDCDRGHRVIFHLRGTTSNRFGIGATVRIETSQGTQVRPLVLARGYMSSSEPMVPFGLGDATTIDRATITWPSGRVQVLSDLKADHRYAVTEPREANAAVAAVPEPRLQFREVARFAGLACMAREARFDESAQQALLPRTFNRCGPAVAVGDLDGDGIDDICLGGTTLDPARVLLADGQGEYHDPDRPQAFANSAVNDGPILILDADGDGKNDLVLTSGGVAAPAGSPSFQPRLRLNEGGARFHPAPAGALPEFRVCVGAACAADFDHDGRLDVFLGGRVRPGEYPRPPPSALWRNRGGTFEDVTDSVAPQLRSIGLVTSALWSDVDGDGWIDLLVALEWGCVRYFHNERGHLVDRSAAAGFTATGNGWWTSLASADFNGDGRPDFVAGNIGLNTPYQPTPDQPVELYRGVFGDGPPLAVEAYHEGDRLYPRATRDGLGAVVPEILRRFPRFDDYAKASLPEILGADKLAAAKRCTAVQMSSGVFLSQPDGTYRFAALPRIAQIAPWQGIAAGDFDGDGHADIVAAENACTYSQTVGRFDGGLGQFLRGDGRGNFTAVEPAECGLVVPGDTRALGVVDFDADGWPDFLITRSRSVTQAWQNRGVAGRRNLVVRLRGAAGNPTAVGARVTVRLADGTARTNEIAAGGGVLSQSTADLHFGYPATNPPDAVSVRWPDGTTEDRAITGAPAKLELQQPGT